MSQRPSRQRLSSNAEGSGNRVVPGLSPIRTEPIFPVMSGKPVIQAQLENWDPTRDLRRRAFVSEGLIPKGTKRVDQEMCQRYSLRYVVMGSTCGSL